MTEEQWEALCHRCGTCCFEKKTETNGTITTTPVPCRHLDVVERTCRVYEKRLHVGEGCLKLTPELVRQSEWLPAHCAYRSQDGAT